VIKQEVFASGVPAFLLVTEVNACVEEVLDCDIHGMLVQSPACYYINSKLGEMSFLLVLS